MITTAHGAHATSRRYVMWESQKETLQTQNLRWISLIFLQQTAKQQQAFCEVAVTGTQQMELLCFFSLRELTWDPSAEEGCLS